MGRLTAYLVGKFGAWERPAQIGFLIALGLFFPVLIVATMADSADLRWPGALSAIGLLMAAQMIFLWANSRVMVTDFAHAQRAYRDNDFETARSVLEAIRAKGKVDSRVLALLGNTYRQLGDLVQSEQLLSEALDIDPRHYFPLYGFGRTLLAQGRYQEATDAFRTALEQGAPAITRFDLAEALWRAGDVHAAVPLLRAVRDELQAEPHRAFMADVWLGEASATEWQDVGQRYWLAQADLFTDTPYGQAIRDDLARWERHTT